MSQKQINVLVADDDESITWTIASVLQRQDPSLKIYQAHNGLEAFGYLKQLKYLDLLITDIHMPHMTGIELLTKLEKFDFLPGIIVITGFGSPDLHNQVEKLGAIRYFTKPVDLNEVAEAALAILKHREKTRETPGFLGSFGSLALVDIIQINSLMRQTGLLEITAGESEGKLYFADGEVIHAECGEIFGEEAVYAIISWGRGAFEFKDMVAPLEQTIRKGWEYLLIEHGRRADHKKSET